MAQDIVVPGVPVSLQTKDKKRRSAWKETVRAAACRAISEDDKHLQGTLLAILIVQYCFGWEEGDLDNIAKPILDGLSGPVYSDDRQVEQLILRRTDLASADIELIDPPPRLADALQHAYEHRQDFIYIRIEPKPDHRRLP